jgi:hypothetical protein
MSALGHEQTSRPIRIMSVIPLKADIRQREWHVRLAATPHLSLRALRRHQPARSAIGTSATFARRSLMSGSRSFSDISAWHAFQIVFTTTLQRQRQELGGVDDGKALGIITALEIKRLVLGGVDMRHLPRV